MARTKTACTTVSDGKRNGNGTARLGFAQKLWLAADRSHGTENAAWDSLRDALLPRLLSGEVRVDRMDRVDRRGE
jgi:hypothetical protein